MTSSFDTEMRMEGADLGRNETKRFYCPYCGEKREKTLSLVRTERGLAYKC